MRLSGEEVHLLEGLIGRKAEKVIVPLPRGSVSKPVETVLVLSKNKGVLIDSCYRAQKAVETPDGYPQMRVRLIDEIPHYANGEAIELSDTGEIVRSVEITNEQVSTRQDTAYYTKSVRIEFTGQREITITRENFRSPSLHIYDENDPVSETTELSEHVVQSVYSI